MEKRVVSVILTFVICMTCVSVLGAETGDFHSAFEPYMAKHKASYVIDIDNDDVPELLGLDENSDLPNDIKASVYKLDDYGIVSENPVVENLFESYGIDGVKCSAFYSDVYGRIYRSNNQTQFTVPKNSSGAWNYNVELFYNAEGENRPVTAHSNSFDFSGNGNSHVNFTYYRNEERFYMDPYNLSCANNLNLLIPVIGQSMIMVSGLKCFPAKDPWSTHITPSVVLNGKLVRFADSKPYIVNGRTLVPMRKCFEMLGADVSWIEAEEKIISSVPGKEIVLQIGSNVMYVNGEAVNLDVAPTLTYERTYVPLRAISEAFGKSIGWDDLNWSVYIGERSF